MDMIDKAIAMASGAHKGQSRKYTGLPYFTHCEAVANAVSAKTSDAEVISAAYLHDVLEDTDVARGELLDTFGGFATSIVVELTDVFTAQEFPYLSRAERKALECKRLRTVSKYAKLIKICDIADNTGDIVANDAKFAQTYLVEKAAMLEACAVEEPTHA